MADLKLIYAAPTEKTALNELQLFKDKWDSKYPKIYKSGHDNWGAPQILYQFLMFTQNVKWLQNQLRENCCKLFCKIIFANNKTRHRVKYADAWNPLLIQ